MNYFSVVRNNKIKTLDKDKNHEFTNVLRNIME